MGELATTKKPLNVAANRSVERVEADWNASGWRLSDKTLHVVSVRFEREPAELLENG